MSHDEESNAVELFDKGGDNKTPIMNAFSAKVHVINDDEEEDKDIDMALTEADINRAFVSL
jgi:hypothetical protein